MWYVYCVFIDNGKTECVNRTFDTARDAVKHIARCYDIDRDLGQLGNYYYYMRRVG